MWNKKSLFSEYLRRHRHTVLTLLLCGIITAAMFYLYRLPVGAFIYTAILCLAALLVMMISGYIKYKRKHEELLRLLHPDNLELNPFPPAEHTLENDYQEIIARLHEHQARLMAEYESSRTEMLDYYTMWVHQIKTPIAAMQLLLKSNDTPENAAVGAELFKIEQYVEMVLSYLRLDSSYTDFVIERISLTELVRQCIRKYARLFVLKKIQLVFNEDDMEILTDKKWFIFVIEQVLSNAIKYTPQGQITITFDRENPALIISDTGIGIHAEDLPRVFDKGFTGYNGRSGQKSSGLGLYLCKRILNQLSHSIAITSTPGQGTTVRIGVDTYPADQKGV